MSFLTCVYFQLSNEVPGVLLWCLKHIPKLPRIYWFLKIFAIFSPNGGLPKMVIFSDVGHFSPIENGLKSGNRTKFSKIFENLYKVKRSPIMSFWNIVVTENESKGTENESKWTFFVEKKFFEIFGILTIFTKIGFFSSAFLVHVTPSYALIHIRNALESV